MSPLPPPQLFDAIFRRHGHYCPMSTLGGRMGFAARRRLGAGALRGEFLIRTCAVDGIVEATGCCEEEGTLVVRDTGRHALILRAAKEGEAVRVVLRPATLDMAWEYRLMDEALQQERNQLAARDLERRLRDKDAFLEVLLQRLRTLPEDELLEIGCLPVSSA